MVIYLHIIGSIHVDNGYNRRNGYIKVIPAAPLREDFSVYQLDPACEDNLPVIPSCSTGLYVNPRRKSLRSCQIRFKRPLTVIF